MVTINEKLLDEKLGQLESMRTWSPRVVSKLEALVRSEDERALVLINPLKFAKDRNIGDTEAVDLFLHAASVGLFELQWHLVCPGCAFLLSSFASLRNFESHGHCGVCQTDVTASLDELVQVTFSVGPLIRKGRFHDPMSLNAVEYVFNYRVSADAHLGAGGPYARDVYPAMGLVCEFIEANTTMTRRITATDGMLAITEVSRHLGSACTIDGAPTSTPTQVKVVVTPEGVECSATTVPPGPVDFTIENRMPSRAALGVVHMSAAELANNPVRVFDPFLTGRMIVANQTFRRLFRSEVIRADEGLAIREVTLLFTDLKGSTALYDRIGDLQAFSLVRQHFDRLGVAVQNHGGAVVKTIGDAVMAVFVDPLQAVRAAVAMEDGIASFNAEHGRNEIILKIGLHRGASIAVTLNENLDFFGQTVNIAARVQGLAEANEICITDSVSSVPGVIELLANRRTVSEQAVVKGVQRELTVLRALAPA